MRPLFLPMDIMHPLWYNARDECGGVQGRIDLHPREMFNAPQMHPLGCVLSKLSIIPKTKRAAYAALFLFADSKDSDFAYPRFSTPLLHPFGRRGTMILSNKEVALWLPRK